MFRIFNGRNLLNLNYIKAFFIVIVFSGLLYTSISLSLTKQNTNTKANVCSSYSSSSSCTTIPGCYWETASTNQCSNLSQTQCSGLCYWRNTQNCQAYECNPNINGCEYTPEQTASCGNFTNQGSCSPTGCNWHYDQCSLSNCMTGCNYTPERWETRNCTMNVCAAYSTCSYTTTPGYCIGPSDCSSRNQTSCTSAGFCTWVPAATTCTGTYNIKVQNASCTGQVNGRCEGDYVSIPARCQKPAKCLPTTGRCTGTPATPTPTRVPTVTPTPGANCQYPAQACNLQNQIHACMVNGIPGTQRCTMTRCTSSSPFICSQSPVNCTPCTITATQTPIPTPTRTPTPPVSGTCSSPSGACNLPNQNVACRVGIDQGVKKCTMTRCTSSSPYVCSLSPTNCTACSLFEKKLNGCYENCLAAGNTGSECRVYPNCWLLTSSCQNQVNNTKCQTSAGYGYCNNFICIADRPAESPCDNGNQCDNGLMCIANVCKRTNLPAGTTCRSNLQCNSKHCINNKCLGVNLEIGQSCISSIQCKSLNCNQNKCASAINQTIGISELGNICGTYSFKTFRCASGLQCKNGVCGKNRLLGQSCKYDIECKSNDCRGVSCTGENPADVSLIPGFNFASDPYKTGTYLGLMHQAIERCIEENGWSRTRCQQNVDFRVNEASNFTNDEFYNECIMTYNLYGDERSYSDLKRRCEDDVANTGKAAIAAGGAVYFDIAVVPIMRTVTVPYIKEQLSTFLGDFRYYFNSYGGSSLINRIIYSPDALRTTIQTRPNLVNSIKIIDLGSEFLRLEACTITFLQTEVFDNRYCNQTDSEFLLHQTLRYLYRH